MNRWLAGVAGLMLGAAGGFYLGQQADRPVPPPAPVTASAPATAPTAPAVPPAAPAAAPTAPSSPPAPAAAAPAVKEPLGFKRFLVDTSRAMPEACLQFSEALSADPAIQYADYLKLEPAARVAVRVT